MNEADRLALRDLALNEALNEETFLHLTWKARLGVDAAAPWQSVVVRPVHLRGGRHLQFSYFDARRNVVKNWRGAEAEAQLDALLDVPFASVQVQSTAGGIVAQMTRKGRIILHRLEAPADQSGPDLEHNRRKPLPLPADRPDAFLQGVGIMDGNGRVRSTMQNKFTQINEFLKLLSHTGLLPRLPQPVRIVDCGCGAALLTMAAHHYCNDVLGIPTVLTGVDANTELIAKCVARTAELGLAGVGFQAAAIADYRPDPLPEIVIALHACDTATDEAIAQGVGWGARLILCAPCCHHDLHRQLQAVAPFGPVLDHGILKQRLADVLTDAFRALALRIMGYRAEVIEFVSTEHTDRNLMIRAVKRAAGAGGVSASDGRSSPSSAEVRRSVREYLELKAFWGVTPAIERLLGERFAGIVEACGL